MHAPGGGSGGPGQRAFFVGHVPAAPGGPAADQGVGLHLQERCFCLAEEKPQVRGLVLRPAKEKPQVRGLVLWPGLLDAGQRGGLPAGNTGTPEAAGCLLATRGHPKRQAANVHQFIISPIQEHSRKPEEARDKIVALMGDVPRVELFARQSPPTRWKAPSRTSGQSVQRWARKEVDPCPM